MFPTQAIRSSTQRKILRVLAEKNKRYTVEELAEMCHRSEASISRALDNADRHPFLQRNNVTGSKKLTARLDPDSQYTKSIRGFFATERQRERMNGTVPVQIWNLLEDIAVMSERKIDSLLEICLFGSYATGDYYSGSDIDLLFLYKGREQKEADIQEEVRHILDTKVPEGQEVQAVVLEMPNDRDGSELRRRIEEKGPVNDVDVLVPLIGEVDLS